MFGFLRELLLFRKINVRYVIWYPVHKVVFLVPFSLESSQEDLSLTGNF